MKTRLLLFPLLIGTAASAQTLGIRLAGAKSAASLSREAFTRTKHENEQSLSFGLFYDRPVWKGIGISTGLNYFRLHDLPQYSLPSRESIVETRDLLELPFYLSLRLAPRRQQAWELQLLAGYAYGKIIGVDQTVGSSVLSSGPPVPVFHRRGSISVPGYHFFNAGFEWTFRFVNRQTISLGLQQRLGWRNDAWNQPGRVRDYCIVLKTGISAGRPAATKK